nr:MAG TPA: hypothetical protein [Caudoviricetes sp.]
MPLCPRSRLRGGHTWQITALPAIPGWTPAALPKAYPA